jgi:hypothetical protein
MEKRDLKEEKNKSPAREKETLKAGGEEQGEKKNDWASTMGIITKKCALRPGGYRSGLARGHRKYQAERRNTSPPKKKLSQPPSSPRSNKENSPYEDEEGNNENTHYPTLHHPHLSAARLAVREYAGVVPIGRKNISKYMINPINIYHMYGARKARTVDREGMVGPKIEIVVPWQEWQKSCGSERVKTRRMYTSE